MEAILVDYLQTVGQLARRCINLLEAKRGVRANPLELPPAYGPAQIRIALEAVLLKLHATRSRVGAHSNKL